MHCISIFPILFLLFTRPLLAETTPSRANAVSIEECFAQKDFSLNLFLKGAPVGVTKEACLTKLVLFRGAGTRWTMDLCDPQITFSYQSPLDSQESEALFSGSAHCPRPLFGIDLKSKPNNRERFEKTLGEVTTLIHEIREGQKDKDTKLTTVYGQLTCLERAMLRYLKECVPFKRPML